ncbi:exodeoxyribonuclease VII large subunit [Paraconexibacter algicola]|uniref:Exodeoxyribonuclease 7 large subunit n=1 Tax=Paraconexibacter algicola TaxID=2133960 RepID=A0A2T4UFH3_9ACTN|nr:exodeoxyribonuclease VII large subunit [Paraconexibacter algicola]PTL56472.1 exodeoxyribonuclease VII large subunit [Paraconexibacter algicola]
MDAHPAPTSGVPGSALPGPYPVGRYALRLRERLREFARVQLTGEVTGLRVRARTVYFELRDGDGALPCAMWRDDHDRLGLPPGALVDGAHVVIAGGVDYYPGSRTSSGAFSFRVQTLRVAGDGDLLAQIALLREQLRAEGLLEPQKTLPRPALPRTVGVVTAETGEARHDVLAGLRRRGYTGRVVWAFAPVQDRHAAPRIARALQDLAATGAVDVIVVARGGGSVTDLLAFSDETLCRTVALLRTPVVAAVGHHGDRTLLDDVAAVSCSTPTHAAEAAVPLDAAAERGRALAAARRLEHHGRHAVLGRARILQRLARAPAEHVLRHRVRLHQLLRELRASGRRQLDGAARELRASADRLEGRGTSAAGAQQAARRARLDSLALALAAHDPERVVGRGYAIVRDADGAIVTTAAAARAAGRLQLRFADAAVDTRVEEPTSPEEEPTA